MSDITVTVRIEVTKHTNLGGGTRQRSTMTSELCFDGKESRNVGAMLKQIRNNLTQSRSELRRHDG